MIAAYTFAAIAAGSLTMVAELIRGVLMTLIEVFALMVMRRIHRGRTAVFEFGSGKLEQLVNLLIAGGLLGGALWIAIDAVQLLAAGEVHGRPAGFALAAIITGVNTYVNVLAWDGVWRAARGGGSLIMQGQLQARVVKLVSSACVLITLSIAALSSDGVVILWADAIGALLVTGFIVHAAVGMIKSGLPDLVDLAVNEEFQAAITRMLARHFDDYDQLGHVRTRRAGDLVHVEIELGFRPDLTIGEVTARIEAMKTNLRQEVGHADISILAMSGG
jgi:divalent metal cation (Fe/Co/Zn/Cd) transporter